MAWNEPKSWSATTLTAADMDEQVRDNLNYLKSNIALGVAGAITVDAGVIIKGQTYHKVLGEGSAEDEIDTIDGGAEGDIIILRPDGYAITLKDGTGNIILGADLVLTSDTDHALLICNDAGNWVKFLWA